MNKINLSDKAKINIIECLKNNRPLSEKYRFLLFGDKKEVELVWKGKTAETTKVSLPFQTLEIIDEPHENTPPPLIQKIFNEVSRSMIAVVKKPVE